MGEQYRVTDPTTNRSLVISMDHEPTDSEIDDIFKTRSAPSLPKVQLPAALDTSKPNPIPTGLAGLKSFLFPSTQDIQDRVAHDLASTADVREQQRTNPSFATRSIDEIHKSAHEIAHEPAAVLDIPHHVGNIMRDAGNTLERNKSKITDAVTNVATLPNIATLAATAAPKVALPINLGYLSKSAYDMYQDPSLENTSNIAKALGNLLMGGVTGISDEPSTISSTRNITPGSQSAITSGNQNLVSDTTGPITSPQSPLGNLKQITANSEVPTVNPPKQIPARTQAGNPVRGQGFTVGAPKVIRPTTEGVYEVPAPMTSRSASTKLTYGGGEGSRLQPESTGFQTAPKVRVPNSSDSVSTPSTDVSQSKIDPGIAHGLFTDERLRADTGTGVAELKKQGLVQQESNGLWSLTSKGKEQLANVKSSVADIPAETPQPTKTAAKKAKVAVKKAKAAPKADEAPVTPEDKPVDTVSNKPAEIENKWLRQSDEQLLHTMRPGATGQLAKEIDAVLAERGLKYEEKPSEPIRPILNKEAFDQYSQVLNDLASHGKGIGHIVLRDAAELGKKAGLDQETIANDLIENLHPEVTNSSNKSWNATKKVFDQLGPED